MIAQLWFKEYTPTWIWAVYPIQPDMASGMAPLGAEALVPLVFFFVLCTAHLVGPACSFFLDIACIRQDSEAAKADGIASLGAVLDRTSVDHPLSTGRYEFRSKEIVTLHFGKPLAE